MQTLRDHRVRGYLQDRYDSRTNAFDWDYHMKMTKICTILHAKQYMQWRERGVAYDVRAGE